MVEAKNSSFPFLLNVHAGYGYDGKDYSYWYAIPVASGVVNHSMFKEFVLSACVTRMFPKGEGYSVGNVKEQGMLRFSFDVLNSRRAVVGKGGASVIAEDALLSGMNAFVSDMKKYVQIKNKK